MCRPDPIDGLRNRAAGQTERRGKLLLRLAFDQDTTRDLEGLRSRIQPFDGLLELGFG